VGVVPVRHVLGELDADDVAQLTASHHVVETAEQVAVSVEVAQRHCATPLGGPLSHSLTALEVEGERLLDEDVVPGVEGEEGRGDVLLVAGGDHGEIGRLRLDEESIPVSERRVGIDPELLDGPPAPDGVALGHADDSDTAPAEVTAVDHPSLAGAYDHGGEPWARGAINGAPRPSSSDAAKAHPATLPSIDTSVTRSGVACVSCRSGSAPADDTSLTLRSTVPTVRAAGETTRCVE
jgi:hypothetical protein